MWLGFVSSVSSRSSVSSVSSVSSYIYICMYVYIYMSVFIYMYVYQLLMTSRPFPPTRPIYLCSRPWIYIYIYVFVYAKIHGRRIICHKKKNKTKKKKDLEAARKVDASCQCHIRLVIAALW